MRILMREGYLMLPVETNTSFLAEYPKFHLNADKE